MNGKREKAPRIFPDDPSGERPPITLSNGETDGWESFELSAYRSDATDKLMSFFSAASERYSSLPPEPDYLVEPYFVLGALTEIVGKIKDGKTTLVMHLVKAVLEGGEFLGRSCKQSKVVYLTEQAVVSFVAQLEQAGIRQHEGLYVLHAPEVRRFSWQDKVKAAAIKCAEVGANLLVIDTVVVISDVDDENSSAEMDRAVEPLVEILSGGLSVVCNRHGRKSGGSVQDAGRGSSAFSGRMDIVVEIKKPDSNAMRNVRHLKTVGRFNLPSFEVVELKDGNYVSHGDRTDFHATEIRNHILSIIPEGRDNAMLTKDIKRHMPSDQRGTTFTSSLKALEGAGEIASETQSGRGSPKAYWKE